MSTVDTFLTRVEEVARLVDRDAVDGIVTRLAALRDGRGRLFMLGVGGSAANASHAVNDFRKLCAIETYTPADNVSELTARTNDEGWETTFEAWLHTSNLCERDAIFVTLAPVNFPRLAAVTLDTGVLGFSLIVGRSVFGMSLMRLRSAFFAADHM